MSHIQLNYAFMWFLSIFEEIHRELFLFKNMAISERRTDILRKFVFDNMFERGKILRNIWICLNNFFFEKTSKMGEILTKTFFLLKVSHIQLNYAFLMFSTIFGKIHGEFLFLVKKVTIPEKAQKYLEICFS